MASVSACPETEKRAIEEVVQGQHYANRLHILFHDSSHETTHPSSANKQALLHKILTCFNQTLALMSSVQSADVSHSQAVSNEDPTHTRNRPASRAKRGCYKRKRAAPAWTVVSASMDDGHARRKYGQKEILNSKYPRSYFRCSRKQDQGCRATKQVQRMEDGCHMYRTTYIGTHTCVNYSLKPGPVHNGADSDLSPTTMQETKEETSSDLTELDCMMWKDLMGDGFEYCSEPGGMVMVPNMYPSSCTEMSFELNFGSNPLDFENGFEFDDTDECVL